jgi:hypothetical protein
MGLKQQQRRHLRDERSGRMGLKQQQRRHLREERSGREHQKVWFKGLP